MDITKLRVYQESLIAFQLIEEVVILLPKDLEDTRRQVLRSSKAVGPILVEGFSRKRSQRDFFRFIIESMGSSDETISHLRNIAMSRFNTVSIEKLKIVAEKYKSISKQLNSLAQKVKQNIV